jgi:hypothetical protein
MRPWMRIFPKRVRHLIICRWKYGYKEYCAGHGRDLAVRYGSDSFEGEW